MTIQQQQKDPQLPLLEKMEGYDAGPPVPGTIDSLRNKISTDGRRDRKIIQDLLLSEGLLAVRLSIEASSVEELQQKLQQELHQNSAETRRRYSQYILRWFFWDGLDGLARRTGQAYGDDQIEAIILRYLYLAAEPVVGTCVEQCLYPLEESMLIPSSYFERYLRDALGEEPPAKTLKRLKTNLAKLGFIDRSTKGDRLNRLAVDKTAFLVVFHSIFSAAGPRTIELSRVLQNPFWKYLGFKSEQSVRAVLKEADASGLLGKYVVADQLEQVTTCFSLAEILKRRVRL
jgi:hypothetical protein